MTKEELFAIIRSNEAGLYYPFSYSSEVYDYLDYVVLLIDKYFQLVAQLDASSIKQLNHSMDGYPLGRRPICRLDLRRDLKFVTNHLKSILTLIYRNYYEDAYNELELLFNKKHQYYLKCLPYFEIRPEQVFYRIRTDAVDNSEKDGAMFHVPFEKRHIVSPNRFSIPGYPALYLAGATFTAWHEMGRPQAFSYAAFRFKNGSRFLDLCIPDKQPGDDQLYSLFVYYPLIVACAISVKHAGAPFVPEYCLPQLMLKMVRNHCNIADGICYLSTKVPDASSREDLSTHNFVVLVNNTVLRHGYDNDLAQRMAVSDIVNVSRQDVDTILNAQCDTDPIMFSLGIPQVQGFHEFQITRKEQTPKT